MKIVKWTRGLDLSDLGNPKLLHPAYDAAYWEKTPEERQRFWEDTDRIVVDCIRRNGFKFGGFYHQGGEFGMPMFDNGTVFFVSLRHWGHLMYEAWEPDGDDPYGYAFYAWDYEVGECKYPASETDFLKPKDEEMFPRRRGEAEKKALAKGAKSAKEGPESDGTLAGYARMVDRLGRECRERFLAGQVRKKGGEASAKPPRTRKASAREKTVARKGAAKA